MCKDREKKSVLYFTIHTPAKKPLYYTKLLSKTQYTNSSGAQSYPNSIFKTSLMCYQHMRRKL